MRKFNTYRAGGVAAADHFYIEGQKLQYEPCFPYLGIDFQRDGLKFSKRTANRAKHLYSNEYVQNLEKFIHK
jgi:hypothetical protein